MGRAVVFVCGQRAATKTSASTSLITDHRLLGHERKKNKWEGRVMKNQSRRDFLIAASAVPVTGAILRNAWIRQAWAQKPSSIAGSEWDYRTAKELVAALQARKISAVELADHVIARIEALDSRL